MKSDMVPMDLSRYVIPEAYIIEECEKEAEKQEPCGLMMPSHQEYDQDPRGPEQNTPDSEPQSVIIIEL